MVYWDWQSWDWKAEPEQGHEIATTRINIIECLSVLPTVCKPWNQSSVVAQSMAKKIIVFSFYQTCLAPLTLVFSILTPLK